MSKVYKIVTDRILNLLDKAEENGEPPFWLKPWNPTIGMPRNGLSGKAYRGINVLLTSCAPFSSNLWFSSKQVKACGGKLKESEFRKNGGYGPTLITFFKFIDKDKNDKKAGRFPILRFYNVWNLEQTENVKVPAKSQEELKQFEDINSAEDILDKTSVRPQTNHGGVRACYFPQLDVINLPEKGAFSNIEHYYNTHFHELVHSTGHADRLKRDLANLFGDHKYSKEELIAEMGSAFLCGIAGFESVTIEDSAAYIRNWKRKLQNEDNVKLIVQAASAAQKACDLILGITFSNEA